jgi:hypothetical protein
MTDYVIRPTHDVLPPDLRGANDGWKRLIPSGNMPTTSPSSRAYEIPEQSMGERARKYSSYINELRHGFRVVDLDSVRIVFPPLDRYGADGFDQPT